MSRLDDKSFNPLNSLRPFASVITAEVAGINISINKDVSWSIPSDCVIINWDL